ncbi:MAG: hypothetical protein K0Q51_492 [Rickettsiaceae bacterium]|jgi:uncharacterized protein|nr:hypothetical protein [Rickettsiaceae bacterium]
MDITPVIPTTFNVITGYSKGSFLINEERKPGNIIISRDNLWRWDEADPYNLSEKSFEVIVNDFKSKALSHNAIILVGSGITPKVANYKLVHLLSLHNLSIDIMTTAAACRTYNILLAEGREVYAALMALE